MIAFLSGILAGKAPQMALVDVNGVGYSVFMSQVSLSKLPEPGERVRVLTHMQVSESGIALYGFLSADEQSLFERLIGVTGVGPKVALAALSTFSPSVLAEAVAAQDVALIAKIPGVGKKTALRIILELKGSFDADVSRGLFSSNGATSDGFSAEAGGLRNGSSKDGRLKDVATALLTMGFTSAEVELALKGAPEDADEETLLRFALKKLSR